MYSLFQIISGEKVASKSYDILRMILQYAQQKRIKYLVYLGMLFGISFVIFGNLNLNSIKVLLLKIG